MAYGDFKDLNIRTATCKVFSNKVFNIAENEKNIWWISSPTCCNGL